MFCYYVVGGSTLSGSLSLFGASDLCNSDYKQVNKYLAIGQISIDISIQLHALGIRVSLPLSLLGDNLLLGRCWLGRWRRWTSERNLWYDCFAINVPSNDLSQLQDRVNVQNIKLLLWSIVRQCTISKRQIVIDRDLSLPLRQISKANLVQHKN